ncbi:MAG TPA: L,D-transpeptidase [Pyrinomonadaceae bacterium]|nr:L,D-transpeptidase [Pyrinomonadaceae bacterium]
MPNSLKMKRHLLILVALAIVCGAGCHQRTSLAREAENQRLAVVQNEPNDPRPAVDTALKLPLKNPRIVVLKSKRRLELYSDGALVRNYKIGLGLNPVPDKQRQGDRATPEGDFYIFTKNDKSAFYLSLGISYPNVEDAERGLRDGLISRTQHDAIVRAVKRKATPPQNTRLGGDIYIHGNGASSDWTWGCVALENEHVKELFDAVPVGTPVTIKP